MAKKRMGVAPLNPIGSRRFARHRAIVLRAITPTVREQWAWWSRHQWNTPARGHRRTDELTHANNCAVAQIAAVLATSITLERLSELNGRRLASLEREAATARVAKTRSRGALLMDQARASMSHVRASMRLGAARSATRSAYFVERPFGPGRHPSAGRDHFVAGLKGILGSLQEPSARPRLRGSFQRWKFAGAVVSEIPKKLRPLGWNRHALRKTAASL